MEIKISMRFSEGQVVTEILELPDCLERGEIEEACHEWIVDNIDWNWEKIPENTS